MSRQARNHGDRRRETVRINGRVYPVVDRVTAAGRTWPVLETTAMGCRRQLKVFDRYASPGGGLRSLYLLPGSQASRQHIEVLRRVSATSSHLPTILECRHERQWIVLIVTGVILFELLTGQVPYSGIGGRVLQVADADAAADTESDRDRTPRCCN